MLWAALLACANSGLGRTSSTGDTGDTGSTATDCPWVGTWELSRYQCGTFDYDPFWASYTGATLVVTQDPTGGCGVSASLRATTCQQTEDWHFAPPVGDQVELTRNGVTNCDPAGCTFENGTVACTPGANTFAATTTTADDSLGDLTLVGLFPEAGSGCPLELISTWSKAR